MEVKEKKTKELTARELKGISGLLLLCGVVFIAASLSYILGAWLGLMIIGVFCVMTSKVFYDSWKESAEAAAEQRAAQKVDEKFRTLKVDAGEGAIVGGGVYTVREDGERPTGHPHVPGQSYLSGEQ